MISFVDFLFVYVRLGVSPCCWSTTLTCSTQTFCSVTNSNIIQETISTLNFFQCTVSMVPSVELYKDKLLGPHFTFQLYVLIL